MLNDELSQTILEEEEQSEYNPEVEGTPADEDSDEVDSTSDLNKSLDGNTNRKSSDSLIDSPVLDKASLHSDTNPIFREVTVTGGE